MRALRMGWFWIAAAAVVLGCVVWAVGWGPFARRTPRRPGNAIMVIAPYRDAGTWVFDDPAAGLAREPFVAGVPEMIDIMVRDIPNAEQGFRLLFSARVFPGYMFKLQWRRGDMDGNWYYCEAVDREGWLCPALLKYFAEPPEEIYVKAEPK